MFGDIIFSALRMLYDAFESNKIARQNKSYSSNHLMKWSLILFLAILYWSWWWFSSGIGGSSPVLFQNGMLYLNYEEDSSGAAMCDTATRLFIAIESPAEDAASRMSARNTWLSWAAPGKGANAKGEKLADYLFFTTDTIATRTEALKYKDMVIVTERGMPQEEWELVEEYLSSQASESKSSRSTIAKETTIRSSSSVKPLVKPKTTTSSTATKASATTSEKGKRHPKLCKDDMLKWCSNVEVGAGRMDECMFEHRESLSKPCRDDLSAYEHSIGQVKRDWYSSRRRLLSWFPSLWSGVEDNSTQLAEAELAEEAGTASSSKRRRKMKSPKLVYEELPWCDEASVLGGCLMKTPSSRSLVSSVPNFRFHSPAQIAKLSTSPSSAGGGQHHDNRHYSPKLLTIFRFWMLEFVSQKKPFTFLLMLDLSSISHGFLCLPSLVTELHTRPHERFIWRSKTCAPTSRRDDSFLLLSRDVVEFVRAGARREGANMLLLDRLLFRLPLSTLSDEKRLRKAENVDWSSYQFRALPKGKSMKAHMCEDMIWVSGLSNQENADTHNQEFLSKLRESLIGKNKKKYAKSKAIELDDEARYTYNKHNATIETIFDAHSMFTKPSDWVRPAAVYPVVNQGCEDEPIIVKNPQMPSGVRSESTKSDREMVTAVRLGLHFDKAEKFLMDTRVVAALTSPLPKIELHVSSPKPIPRYYSDSPIDVEPAAESKEAIDLKQDLKQQVSERRETTQVMPRVPRVETKPSSSAVLKSFNPHGRRLHSLRGSEPLVARTSLGVRPRLTAWGGNEFNTKRPVIDACSFDIECVWEKIKHEELAEWWLEADSAREECCCASRASQAPPQCSSFKTRRYIKSTDYISNVRLPKQTSDETAAQEWSPLSVSEAWMDDAPSENWTIRDEFSWIEDLARSKFENLNNEEGEEEDETSSAPEEVDRELFLDRGITVLASFPGSGNTWVRLLLEYATGYFTGSIYNDLALSPLLPGEGDMSSKVIAVKAHTAPSSYLHLLKDVRNVSHPTTGVKRVLLLVRHPLEAIWSEFQRRHAGTHVGTATELKARAFESFSGCMACRWIHYLLKHFELASELSTFGGILNGLNQADGEGGVKVHIIKYERLKGKQTFLSELASALAFLGAEVPSPERLGCASFLAKHSAVHRPKPRAFKLQDVYNAVPGLSCRLWHILSKNHPAASLLLRLFNYESYAPENTCDVKLNLHVCPDILSDNRVPIQTCAGRQVDNFDPAYDKPIVFSNNRKNGPITAKSMPMEDDHKLVEAMNVADFEKNLQSLDAETESAWANAIEPLHWEAGPSEPSSSEMTEEGQAIKTRDTPTDQTTEVVKPDVITNNNTPTDPTTEVVKPDTPEVGTWKETVQAKEGCEGPLISILVSTTSRGVVKKGKTKELSKAELEARMKWVEDTTKALDLHTLVLFSTMLPSLIKTMECGFSYHVVIGFDVGDIYFDSPSTQVKMRTWIDDNVVFPASKRGISCSYTLLPVDNPLKKPGPVFNAMARAIQHTDVEYVYRVNDDTEFVNVWASKFVRTLQAMGGPAYGVVGPSCPQGNRAILTHDFTHRAHLDIFDTYYPDVLSDWFMDDWISRVYGLQRTQLMKDVEVIHHSKTYGRRYDVDGTHRHLVDNLVNEGKHKIASYMKEHGGSKEMIHRFLSDKFDHRQQQKEVDQSTIKSKSAAIRPK